MAASTQILLDTDSKTVVKCLYFDASGTEEASVLKVNTATLKGRVWTLTVNVAPFSAGAQLPVVVDKFFTTDTGNTGYILSYTRAAGANQATMTVVGSNGAFNATGSANVTVVQSPTSNVSIDVDAVANATGIVSIASANWAVSGNATIQVQWQGTTNSDAIILAGTGYMGKNNMSGVSLPNNNGAPTGGIVFSTFNLEANSGYTVILELHKISGFSARNGY